MIVSLVLLHFHYLGNPWNNWMHEIFRLCWICRLSRNSMKATRERYWTRCWKIMWMMRCLRSSLAWRSNVLLRHGMTDQPWKKLGSSCGKSGKSTERASGRCENVMALCWVRHREAYCRSRRSRAASPVYSFPSATSPSLFFVPVTYFWRDLCSKQCTDLITPAPICISLSIGLRCTFPWSCFSENLYFGSPHISRYPL